MFERFLDVGLARSGKEPKNSCFFIRVLYKVRRVFRPSSLTDLRTG